MSLTVFDRIVSTFSVALDGAYASLHVYSLGLLGLLGLMQLYLLLSKHVSYGMSDLSILAELIWGLVKLGVFFWVCTILYDVAWNRFFMTFLQWGMEAGGGQFSLESFLNPSGILTTGFTAALPLYDYLNNTSGPMLLWRAHHTATYLVAYWLIIVSYGAMALAASMALIETKLAIATAAILIPWGVLSHTASLAEVSLSWLTACMVRILLTAALIAIGIPLFDLLAVDGTTDPTVQDALVMAGGALLFAGLAWVLPGRAAGMAGRGVSLALGNDIPIGAGMAGVASARYAMYAAGETVRGVSQMLHRV